MTTFIKYALRQVTFHAKDSGALHEEEELANGALFDDEVLMQAT